MRYVAELPNRVRVIEHTVIPLSDGTRLAAKLWLPEGAADAPVPAILEYIPYRKRDVESVGDSIMHGYFADHGYACARVDLRGAGDSEGVLEDEYLEREQLDGLEVLRWLAAQRWCDGRVGMIGISWGGFNGLQIAALQPPELGAVITVCSTDDRYADDIHHMGGCLLGDNLSWASTMFAYNSLPPDPALVGGSWRRMWRQRLEGSGLWLEKWLRHQRRDEYWRHGSVCESYGAIRVPVYAVSGWADGYSNAVFRLLANHDVPRKGLVGPWSHKYPHLGAPGPAIGFLQEAVRWWDQWLKGMDTGVMNEPMLRAWMQDSVPPTTAYKERPARWVGERQWPSPNVRERRYELAPGRLLPAGQGNGADRRNAVMDIQSPLTVGLFAGKWCSYAAGPDLAHDQREEDGGALVFETGPLADRLEILGAPVAELDIEANRPVAMVAARLSDVAPDGKATRVTYGLLNLTQRDSRDQPAPLEPGRRYRVAVRLNEIAQVFPAGHRLRLSLSTSYWPLAWPPPEPVRLRVHTGASRLVLPERPGGGEAPGLGEPEGAVPLEKIAVEPGRHNWLVHRDLASDVSTLEVINDQGVYYLPHADLSHRIRTVERYCSRADDFESVRGETDWQWRIWRDDWAVSTRTCTLLTCTPTQFRLAASLDAFEGERRVYSHNWDLAISRDLV